MGRPPSFVRDMPRAWTSAGTCPVVSACPRGHAQSWPRRLDIWALCPVPALRVGHAPAGNTWPSGGHVHSLSRGMDIVALWPSLRPCSGHAQGSRTGRDERMAADCAGQTATGWPDGSRQCIPTSTPVHRTSEPRRRAPQWPDNQEMRDPSGQIARNKRLHLGDCSRAHPVTSGHVHSWSGRMGNMGLCPFAIGSAGHVPVGA